MMRPTIVFAALSALGMVAAQNFTVDPNSVASTTKANWCLAERNNCETLCGGGVKTKTDTCDTTTLDYNCTCSNGSAPGLSYYTGTIPTFICETAYANCISEYENDLNGQRSCNTTILDYCGTLDPNTANAAASSSSASASASATGTATTGSASGSSATAASSTTAKGAAATNMAVLGNGAAVVAVGLFAALL